MRLRLKIKTKLEATSRSLAISLCRKENKPMKKLALLVLLALGMVVGSVTLAYAIAPHLLYAGRAIVFPSVAIALSLLSLAGAIA
jgi:hypothetical protein